MADVTVSMSLVDNVTSTLSKIQGSLGRTESAMERMNNTTKLASGLTSKLGVVAGAVAGVAQNVVNKAFTSISENIAGAVNRADQMNNFPKVMQNLGYSSEDAARSIKKISSALDGLPTSSATMSKMVQTLAPLTSNLDDATNIALAFNNAMLAGGASTSEQENALTQYSQMLAAGKVDMAAWRSVQAAMPGQLNQLAVALLGAGKNGNDLYDAMKDGTVTFDDFNKAVVKLNKQGIDGFASFEKQARDSTAGIATALENVKSRIQKAIQKVVEAIGVEDIATVINKISSQFGKIGDAVAGVIKDVKSKVKGAISLLKSGKVTDAWQEAFKTDSWAPALRDALYGIRKTWNEAKLSIEKSLEELGAAWSKILPPESVKKALDGFVSGTIKVLGSAIEHVVSGVSKVVGWISDFGTAVANSGGVQQFASGVQAVAGAIGNLFSSFNTEDVGNINNLGLAFGNAKDLGSGFGEVLGTIGGNLQKVADGINAVKGFIDDFMKTADQLGTFDTYKDTLDDFFSSVQKWAEKIQKLYGAVKDFIELFTPLQKKADETGKTLSGGDLAKGADGVIKAWSRVLGVISDVIDGIADGVDQVADNIERITGLLSNIPDVTHIFGSFMQNGGLTNPFSGLMTAWDVVRTQFSSSEISSVFEGGFSTLGSIFSKAKQTINDFFTDALIPESVQNFFAQIRNSFSTNFPQLQSDWSNGWSLIQTRSSEVWNTITTNAGTWFASLQPTIQNGLLAIQGIWDGMWSGLANFVITSWTNIFNGISSYCGSIQATISGVLAAIQGMWSSAWNTLLSILNSVWNSIVSAVQNGVNSVVNVVSTIKSRILGFFSGAGGWLVGAGQSIINGLVSGVQSAIGGAVSSVSGAVSRIRDLFPFSPAKTGPFSGHGWVLYSGMSIANAFADGIVRNGAVAQNAAANLMASTQSQLTGGRFDMARSYSGAVTSAPSLAGSRQRTTNNNVTNNRPVSITINGYNRDPNVLAREIAREIGE